MKDREGGGSGHGARGSWKVLALVLAAGVLVVFVYHLASLLGAFGNMEAGFETGALWAILFMIAVTFGTIALIGGGLAATGEGRDGRKEAETGDAPDGAAEGRALDVPEAPPEDEIPTRRGGEE